MKDSDQKDDYYSVSKQPPIPMGAPPPPAPMGMPMGMPPMRGPMPTPGAPMAPQEEELQEGEYMDPVTGKVMRRGEEFKVDPDRELDDPKNVAKWFSTLQREDNNIRKFLGRFRRPRSRFSNLTDFENAVRSAQSIPELHSILEEAAADPKIAQQFNDATQGSFTLERQVTEESSGQNRLDNIMNQINANAKNAVNYGQSPEDAASLMFTRQYTRTLGIRDKAEELMPRAVEEAMVGMGYQPEAQTVVDEQPETLTNAERIRRGLPYQPREDGLDLSPETRQRDAYMQPPEQTQQPVAQSQQEFHMGFPVQEQPQPEERPFEDPFLQYKSWFKEVLRP